MITVRLIKRTHYQVLEPAILTPLIRECTSPTRSSYRNAAAQRFLETTAGVNIAASGYAVDLARSLNLLNSNLVWTELGQLLNIVASKLIPPKCRTAIILRKGPFFETVFGVRRRGPSVFF